MTLVELEPVIKRIFNGAQDFLRDTSNFGNPIDEYSLIDESPINFEKNNNDRLT